MRFKDLSASINGCSDRVLCERLKELEDEHIVVRNTYKGENRIDYSLTAVSYTHLNHLYLYPADFGS